MPFTVHFEALLPFSIYALIELVAFCRFRSNGGRGRGFGGGLLPSITIGKRRRRSAEAETELEHDVEDAFYAASQMDEDQE